MSYENKPHTGALFKNANKQSENHPDYRGPFYDANGNEMEVSAWLKTSKNGSKYMSLQVRPKFQKQAKPAEKPKDEFSDSIPFAWALAPAAGLIVAALYSAGTLIA